MTWMMSKSNIWNGHELVGYIWERATIYAKLINISFDEVGIEIYKCKH